MRASMALPGGSSLQSLIEGEGGSTRQRKVWLWEALCGCQLDDGLVTNLLCVPSFHKAAPSRTPSSPCPEQFVMLCVRFFEIVVRKSEAEPPRV